MAIDTSFNPPKGDPVADWRTQEKAGSRAEALPAYEQVKIEPIDFGTAGPALTGSGGTRRPNGRLHISNMGCRVNAGRGHAIYWQTPDALWDDFATVNKFRCPSGSLP